MDFYLPSQRRQLHQLDEQQQTSSNNLRSSSYSLSIAARIRLTFSNIWMDHYALHNSNLKRKRYRWNYAWIRIRTIEENKVLTKWENNRSYIHFDMCYKTWNRVAANISNHFSIRELDLFLNGNLDRTRISCQRNNVDGNYIFSTYSIHENPSLLRIQVTPSQLHRLFLVSSLSIGIVTCKNMGYSKNSI